MVRSMKSGKEGHDSKSHIGKEHRRASCARKCAAENQKPYSLRLTIW